MLCPKLLTSFYSFPCFSSFKNQSITLKEFFFLLNKTCFLFFHLNWKIAQAKWCILSGTAIPTAQNSARQISTWHFSLQSFHKSSPDTLGSGQIIPPFLDTDLSLAVLIWKSSSSTTRFSFMKLLLSAMKLMPRSLLKICCSPADHVWKNQPSQRNQSLQKKKRAKAKHGG